MSEPLIKKVYSRKHPISIDYVSGDFHVGHKCGICHPDILEDDYKMNKGQMWLWSVFCHHFIPDLKHIIKLTKPKHVHGLFGGDMGDRDAKNRSNQFWTKKATLIEDNAVELLEPLTQLCDSLHFLKGTRSHTGDEIDNAIAVNFDHAVGDRAHYEANYILEDVKISARHYGKNRSKWADTNLLNGLRSEIILEYAKSKKRIPDMNYRHHFHWFGMTPEYEPYRVVSIPSFQLPYDQDYVAEIDPVGKHAYVGGFVAVYQNGKVVDDFPLTYTYPKEDSWTPK